MRVIIDLLSQIWSKIRAFLDNIKAAGRSIAQQILDAILGIFQPNQSAIYRATTSDGQSKIDAYTQDFEAAAKINHPKKAGQALKKISETYHQEATVIEIINPNLAAEARLKANNLLTLSKAVNNQIIPIPSTEKIKEINTNKNQTLLIDRSKNHNQIIFIENNLNPANTNQISNSENTTDINQLLTPENINEINQTLISENAKETTPVTTENTTDKNNIDKTNNEKAPLLNPNDINYINQNLINNTESRPSPALDNKTDPSKSAPEKINSLTQEAAQFQNNSDKVYSLASQIGATEPSTAKLPKDQQVATTLTDLGYPKELVAQVIATSSNEAQTMNPTEKNQYSETTAQQAAERSQENIALGENKPAENQPTQLASANRGFEIG
jgi:hypothetical protein